MSKSNKDGNYTVGYGKPPTQYRFKKGQSGNPRGRPRMAKKEPKAPSFQDGLLDKFLEQEAFRPLQLRENGKAVEMNAAQAIIRSIMVDGVKGNRLAKKYALELLRQEEQDAFTRSLSQFKVFARKKAEGETEIARCKEQHLPPPLLFPHPDDILLDEAELEVRIIGPMTEEQGKHFEQVALIRDWFLTYSVFEEKYGKVKTVEYHGHSASARSILALIIDRVLPPSYQRSRSSLTSFLMDLHGLTEQQIRQRMQLMMAQIGDIPDNLKDRLAARENARNILKLIVQGLEKTVADIAK